jgi:hypothetical protein
LQQIFRLSFQHQNSENGIRTETEEGRKNNVVVLNEWEGGNENNKRTVRSCTERWINKTEVGVWNGRRECWKELLLKVKFVVM